MVTIVRQTTISCKLKSGSSLYPYYTYWIGSSFRGLSLSLVLKLLMGVRKRIWGSLAESFQKICCQYQRMMRMSLVLALRRMRVRRMMIVTVWVT